jgi:hypothetical protein
LLNLGTIFAQVEHCGFIRHKPAKMKAVALGSTARPRISSMLGIRPDKGNACCARGIGQNALNSEAALLREAL